MMKLNDVTQMQLENISLNVIYIYKHVEKYDETQTSLSVLYPPLIEKGVNRFNNFTDLNK